MKKDYNIGLDIGTSSVGWAVVEPDTQKIIRKGNKRLWGVRLFESAMTAEVRRNFRSTRRRYDRRRERIRLLQEEFKNEINQCDRTFYQKLEESFYNELDVIHKKNPLTKEERISIKKYNELYPTIYHLRKKLIESKEKEDIRLVYLAIHHIIKYRGNFLYNGDKFNVNNLDIPQKLESILNMCTEVIPEVEQDIYAYDLKKISSILLETSKNDRKVYLKEELSINFPKYFIDEFTKMINGNIFNFTKMLSLEAEEVKLSFNNTDYDDKFSEYESKLGKHMELLGECKELYDMLFLKRLFKNSQSISLSSLMVEKYLTHRSDLRFLKSLLYYDKKIYRLVFRNDKNGNDKCLYEKYIHNKISNTEFCKEIQKHISKIFDNEVSTHLREQYVSCIQNRLENGEFLPRITDTENGKYPYQLNKEELIKIIENQGEYYPFLLNKTNDDKYKLVKLLEFKIPYYVGPLVSDKSSPFAWMERKKDNVRITPYNFDEIVDKELTAEKFIKRMISHCTYLLDEEAMPTNSILYSKFKVLNELKQIKINGEKIAREIQQKIYNELFLTKPGTITEKVFKEYIHSSKDFEMYGDITIQGYSADKRFANTMQSYIDFFGENGIFDNTNYSIDDAERIIEWITIFEDKDILKNKVLNVYKQLSDSQVKMILEKKYKGWSGLSKKLLTQKYYSKNDFEDKKSILDLMAETDKNFIQILNDNEYKFQDMIAELNCVDNISKVNYEVVEKLATSPATKRGIYQALKIVEEIVKYMGYEPKNIVIEMARGDAKKERKDDKKQYLTKLYENAKKDISNYNYLKKQLNEQERIDTEKLFLYFIQEGKSLYSGKPLDINSLKEYEVDHVIPRTLIKDNSIDNKALVLREENQIKAANFVLPKEYRNDYQIIWWSHLKKVGLMSNKKFNSLIRKTYSDEDIEIFINRQLVETRQITKHVANILGNYYKKSTVIYLHANLLHNYRERYELYKFRDINDYHHAHDAYLAAVLGEYKEKLMKRKIDFEIIKDLNSYIYKSGNHKRFYYGYVINSLDTELTKELDRIGNIYDDITGEILFDADSFNERVANNLLCNDILISRKTEVRTGEFYNQTIYPANRGQIELKKGLNSALYGGYSSVNCSYLALIQYKNKKKLIGIPIQVALKNKTVFDSKDLYIREQLKIKDDETYEILRDFIPFDTLINYKNQLVYIKGYSTKKRNFEVCNAKQLKIPKNKMMKWKYVLNEILNNYKKYEKDYEEVPFAYIDQAKEILMYLFQIKNEYPLFTNELSKTEELLEIDTLQFKDIAYIIREIFKIYHCNSVNGNLKQYGLGDRIGRLSGKTIDSGTIFCKSTTGIKETNYLIGE